jgi:hypothetical protein
MKYLILGWIVAVIILIRFMQYIRRLKTPRGDKT